MAGRLYARSELAVRESVDSAIRRIRDEWSRYDIGVQPHDLKWAALVIFYAFGGHASIQLI